MRVASALYAGGVDPASLVAFRVAFGLLMLVSTLRFWLRGWIETLYLQPSFHFKYDGFEWVRVLPEQGMYAVFIVMAVASFGIALGRFYRLSTVVFFIVFVYVELIDKALYLNHYVFVSLIAFTLSWSPAPTLHRRSPTWLLLLLRLQVGLVYLFAGLAKLNSDWVLRAEPMRTWLAARTDFPLIGPWFDELWVAHAMSWSGAAFDILAFPLLLWRRTRIFAFALSVVFHLATYALFPNIGMFPFIMIVSASLFLSPSWPRRVFRGFLEPADRLELADVAGEKTSLARWQWALLATYVALQVFVPMRRGLYPGNTNWTEEGYRLGWNVMLMEKTGDVTFLIVGTKGGRRWEVDGRSELTPAQHRQMRTQPDMIAEYARHLARRYRALAGERVQVFAHTHVSFNGRRGRPIVDPTVDLASTERSIFSSGWVVPLEPVR